MMGTDVGKCGMVAGVVMGYCRWGFGREGDTGRHGGPVQSS